MHARSLSFFVVLAVLFAALVGIVAMPVSLNNAGPAITLAHASAYYGGYDAYGYSGYTGYSSYSNGYSGGYYPSQYYYYPKSYSSYYYPSQNYQNYAYYYPESYSSSYTQPQSYSYSYPVNYNGYIQSNYTAPQVYVSPNSQGCGAQGGSSVVVSGSGSPTISVSPGYVNIGGQVIVSPNRYYNAGNRYAGNGGENSNCPPRTGGGYGYGNSGNGSWGNSHGSNNWHDHGEDGNSDSDDHDEHDSHDHDDHTPPTNPPPTNPPPINPPPTSGTNFDKGYVSFTFDDGWMSQYNNVLPMFTSAGLRGTFYVISQYTLRSQINLMTDPQASADMQTVQNSQSTSWGPIYTDPSQHGFEFNDTYTASAQSTVVATFLDANSVQQTQTLGTLPAGTNASAHLTFTLPVLGGPVTIVHSVSSGNLSASNPSLKQESGYMGTSEVAAIQNAGNEIGDHTQTHADLSTLSASGVQQEIVGAKNDLLSFLSGPINTFAYPYGAETATTLSVLQSNGFIGARGTNVGFNDKTTNKYSLLVKEVNNATSAADMIGWINEAIAQKKWLILELHQVDHSSQQYATTPEILQQVVNFAKVSGAGVITTREGLQMMN